MRLRLFKPLFKLFNLQPERITYLLEQLLGGGVSVEKTRAHEHVAGKWC